jgi:hypothetical protein
MIVILAANVRILIRGFAGKIRQRKAKNHFLFALLCICVDAANPTFLNSPSISVVDCAIQY